MKADSVILELSNPELEQELLDAELRLREGESVLTTRAAQLESDVLNQEAAVQAVDADWKSAKLQADADRQLSEDKLIPAINLKRSLLREEQLGQRVEIEKQRLEKARQSTDAQLVSERARVEQLQALYHLRQKQFENLKVKAGIDGVLQQVPVEVGQQCSAGTNLARVARPDTLKAELRIPETQAKDVAVGQKASIDNRNAVAEGRVTRIDPAVQEGYVRVDVEFTGDAAQRRAARPVGGRHHRDRAPRRRPLRRPPRLWPGRQHHPALQAVQRRPVRRCASTSSSAAPRSTPSSSSAVWRRATG